MTPPGVFWLNSFGPAFLEHFPGLRDVEGHSVELANGGRLVRTTPDPWVPFTTEPDWTRPLLALFGPETFEQDRSSPGNPRLPTLDEHLAASPGTAEMPWESWEREQERRSEADAAARRRQRHGRARERLERAFADRPRPERPVDPTEWSTSFDLDDWRPFFSKLRRHLRGDLRGEGGTALRTVVETTPLDDEDSVLLATVHGTIELGWFVDDVDVVDITILGPASVVAVCDALLDRP